MACLASPERYRPSQAEKLILHALFQDGGCSRGCNPFSPVFKTALADLREISPHWTFPLVCKWLWNQHRKVTQRSDGVFVPPSHLEPPSPAEPLDVSLAIPSQPEPPAPSDELLNAVLDAPPLFANPIQEIVTSIFHVVAATDAIPGPTPQLPHELVQFVAEKVFERLVPLIEELSLDICRSCSDEIGTILDGPKAPKLQNLHLDQARLIRQQKRAERRRNAEQLTQLRLDAAARVTNDESADTGSLIALLDEDAVAEESECCGPLTTFDAFKLELLELLKLDWTKKNRRRYASCPFTLKFAFLLACHSRPALDIARQFLPLPSYETVQKYYDVPLRTVERGLSDLALLKQQIRLGMETTSLPGGSFVSIAVDAMAMNPDSSYLPANHSDNQFVIYVQPLDRRYSCWPLHMMAHPSGRATEDVLDAMKAAREALTAQGLVVKFECSDGDAGHNQSHRDFFGEWYQHFLDNGLTGALEYAAGRDAIPAGDFLHLLKTFLNKVKNHLVVMSPDCLETSISVTDLESLLHLGRALSDKSSVGRMRDSYALQLFSISNCLKCLSAGHVNEFMFMLPWALQEEVIRAPELSRQERLMKAVFSFKLLMHYFDLSSIPRAPGVTQRFTREETIAVTFAEDSVWPRILNSALALILFILHAEEHWSFSRMGTHCLENFFGLVRRSSLGDDRSVTAKRVVVRASLVAQTMHELKITVKHRGRDNVGGVVITGDIPVWDDSRADRLYRSVIAQSGLEIVEISRSGLLPKSAILDLLREWVLCDHHAKDPAYHANFDAKPANARISARLMVGSPIMRGIGFPNSDDAVGGESHPPPSIAPAGPAPEPLPGPIDIPEQTYDGTARSLMHLVRIPEQTFCVPLSQRRPKPRNFRASKAYARYRARAARTE
jgi:hypothetical protein